MGKRMRYFKVYRNVFKNINSKYEKPRLTPIATAQEIPIVAYSQRQAEYFADVTKRAQVIEILRHRFPEKFDGVTDEQIVMRNCDYLFKPDWR